MKDHTAKRWFWVVTTCNVAATILLLLLIYSALVMLALFTSPTTMLPFLLLPTIVLTLSVFGFVLSRRQRHRSRWIGYIVHSGGFLLSFMMLAYLAFLRSGIGSGRETYLIPDGYQGDVYVIYPLARDDAHPDSSTASTYRIPRDGVLLASNVEVKGWSGWTQTRYYYVSNNGQRKEITEHWDSTIPETPENLSNTRDIGIFFPQTGTFRDAAGCHLRFEKFYVGTKAYLLRQHKSLDVDDYLRQHNSGCPIQER